MGERITDTSSMRVMHEDLSDIGFVEQNRVHVDTGTGYDKRYVRVSTDYGGRELLVDQAYFEPKAYAFGPEERPHRIAGRVIRDAGAADIHLTGVLDGGTNGVAGANKSGVSFELVYDAANRGATEIMYGQSLDLSRRIVQFAAWDNGAERPIDDSVDMINQLMDLHNLKGVDPELANATFSLYTLARRAVFYRNAKFVMAQGTQKVTLSSQGDSNRGLVKREDETLEYPLEGVATMLELPYHFDVRADPEGYVRFHAENAGVDRSLNYYKLDSENGGIKPKHPLEVAVRRLPRGFLETMQGESSTPQ